MVSLTSTKDLLATTISVIDKNKVIDLKELFLFQVYAIADIVGVPVATLDSLQKLAEAINSDAIFLNNIMAAVGLKSYFTYVNILYGYTMRNFFNYDTIDTATIKSNLKSDTSYVDTLCNSIIHMFFKTKYDTILEAYIKLVTKSYIKKSQMFKMWCWCVVIYVTSWCV